MKLTKPQRNALAAVEEGRIWVWKGGSWGQSRWAGTLVRKNVLDRLLADGWIEVLPELQSDSTYAVVLKDRKEAQEIYDRLNATDPREERDAKS